MVAFGSPLKLRLTVPEKPLMAETVIVNFVLDLRLTVWLAGEAAIEKSPTAALTARVTVAL